MDCSYGRISGIAGIVMDAGPILKKKSLDAAYLPGWSCAFPYLRRGSDQNDPKPSFPGALVRGQWDHTFGRHFTYLKIPLLTYSMEAVPLLIFPPTVSHSIRLVETETDLWYPEFEDFFSESGVSLIPKLDQ
jgi:hypothetical protein